MFNEEFIDQVVGKVIGNHKGAVKHPGLVTMGSDDQCRPKGQEEGVGMVLRTLES